MNYLTCSYCNTEFERESTRKSALVFCCREHHTLYRKEMKPSTDLACENCGSTFHKQYTHQKYCGRSCAASANNRKAPKRTKTLRYCYKCRVNPVEHNNRPCSECRIPRHTAKDWIDGTWAGGSDTHLSKVVRRWLLDEANHSCVRCGFDTPHPDDGQTILEINHIDGDGSNHNRSNLEVICPNCHALTSSYRGRNLGNGRRVKYLRVPV